MTLTQTIVGESPYDPSTLPVAIYGEMTDESAKYTAQFDKELVAITDGLKAKG